MFERDDSASTALISFMLGGVAGAALAVLFAPGAGSDTRRRLGDGVRDGAERGAPPWPAAGGPPSTPPAAR